MASIGKIALCALLAPLLTTPLPQNGSLTAPICIFEYIEYIELIEYTDNCNTMNTLNTLNTL